jgi:ubiquinone/menaquinone biosynthesis C-methylase UbiE
MPDNSLLSIARWYDPIFERLNRGLRVLASRVVPPEEGLNVLDIGCGTGSQLALYQAGGSQVFGIDLALPMLIVAKHKLNHMAGLVNGDVLAIPYPDHTFDLVIGSLFIHQFDPVLRAAVLKEAMRVLTPSGQILLIDFHSPEKRSLTGYPMYLFISVIEFFAGWEHFSNSRDFLTSGGIPSLAAELGLRNRKSIVVGNGNLGIYLLRLY